jgi:hypothetical protein
MWNKQHHIDREETTDNTGLANERYHLTSDFNAFTAQEQEVKLLQFSMPFRRICCLRIFSFKINEN